MTMALQSSMHNKVLLQLDREEPAATVQGRGRGEPPSHQILLLYRVNTEGFSHFVRPFLQPFPQLFPPACMQVRLVGSRMLYDKINTCLASSDPLQLIINPTADDHFFLPTDELPREVREEVAAEPQKRELTQMSDYLLHDLELGKDSEEGSEKIAIPGTHETCYCNVGLTPGKWLRKE